MYEYTGFSFGAENDDAAPCGYFQNENFTLCAVCGLTEAQNSARSAPIALEALRSTLEGESHLGTLKNAEYPAEVLSEIMENVRTEWKRQIEKSFPEFDENEWTCSLSAVFESGGKTFAVSFGKGTVALIGNDGKITDAFGAFSVRGGDFGKSKEKMLSKTLFGTEKAVITSPSLDVILAKNGKTEEFYRLLTSLLEEKTTKEAKEIISAYIKKLPGSVENRIGAVIFKPEE